MVRKDFTKEQVEFCLMLQEQNQAIEEKARIIKDCANHCTWAFEVPGWLSDLQSVPAYLSELFTIVTSFPELSIYWDIIHLSPTFEIFIKNSNEYLEGVLMPAIEELKQKKLPLEGEEGSGVNDEFIRYLEEAENIGLFFRENFKNAPFGSKYIKEIPTEPVIKKVTGKEETGVIDGIIFVKGVSYGNAKSPEQEERIGKILRLDENTPELNVNIFGDMKDNTVYAFISRANDSLFGGKKVLHKDGGRTYWSI